MLKDINFDIVGNIQPIGIELVIPFNGDLSQNIFFRRPNIEQLKLAEDTGDGTILLSLIHI